MNLRSPFRSATLLVLFALVLAGCSVSGKGSDKVSITLPSNSGAIINPFITGLWPSDVPGGHSDQLTPYLKWFRGQSDTPPDASNAILDPSCPLEYDYQKMATTGQWNNRSDALFISDVNQTSNTGFYNPARMEVLILLRGHTFNLSDGTPGHCNDASLEAYVPVRVNLGAGTWEIDGWASPASTIVVQVAQGFTMVPVKNDHEIADDHSIISPFRLNRFQITPENYDRVIRYATLNDANQGYSRKIIWFRESDISPSYAHLATNTQCLPAYFAFWDKDNHGDDALGPCSGQALNISDRDVTSFIDRGTRMTSGSDVVWDSPGDDTCSSYSVGSCDKLDTATWKRIAELETNIIKDQSSSGYRAAVKALHDYLVCYDTGKHLDGSGCGSDAHNTNLASDFAPPDEFGGWDHTDSGLFAIIASGGHEDMGDTKDAISNGGTNRGLVGFVGSPPSDNPGSINSVTLSPSFSYAAVSTDEKAAAFYDKYSLLLNNSQKEFDVMAFSTSGNGAAGASLPYEQSPLAQITINVSDTLNSANTSTYKSNWLPLLAMQRNAGALSIKKGFDLLGDFGGSVERAVSGLMYDIYRGTVGGWLSGLAQAATSNLLAVPTLDPYQVSYIRPDGTAVYAVNTSLIRWDAVIAGIVSGHNTPPWGLKGDEATCTVAALSAGGLTSPDNTVSYGGTKHLVSPCFVQNQAYGLFNVVRGLSLLLAILLMGRYFLALMSGGAERRKFGLTAFFARCIFVFALILGMDTVLRILGSIVAETVLVTNLIGTQAGGGTPYSHLWLFSAYLNSPSRDLNIFAMFVMSPFLILGMFVLLVSNWLRFALTYFVVGVSPMWVISLLNSARPSFFYRSLLWMLRLYLIPLLALVVILLLFIVARMLGISATSAGLVEAIVGMLMLIAVAVIPALLAKWLIGFAGEPIKAALTGALQSIESHSGNVALEAIAGGTTAEAAAEAQKRRLDAFRLPEAAGTAAGADPGAMGGASPYGALPSVAGPGGPGPGSTANLGGPIPISAGPGGWGAPTPDAGGGWPAPGGVPGLGFAGGSAAAQIAAPPAAPLLQAPEMTAALPEADLSGRRSLKMRILRGAAAAPVLAAGKVAGATAGAYGLPSLDQLKSGPRAALEASLGMDMELKQAVDSSGKPLFVKGPDGKDTTQPLMTPGGRPPLAFHDVASKGLSYLTGTAVVSEGFDPGSRTGMALASLDRRSRAAESLVSSGATRLGAARAAMHANPEITGALSAHASAVAALESGAQSLEGPRAALSAALKEAAQRGENPVDSPQVILARRSLEQAESALQDQQRRAGDAWEKVAGLAYRAPTIGDARHVAADRMAFEQARQAALSQHMSALHEVSATLSADTQVLDTATRWIKNRHGEAGPLVARATSDLADSARAAAQGARDEAARLRAVAVERHENLQVLTHEQQRLAASRQPPLRLSSGSR